MGFEQQLRFAQAIVLLIHFVALAGQLQRLLGQLFVGLLQLGLLLLHVHLRLAQGIGLLFELLVGGTQLFLLNLQFFVELLGFAEYTLQTLAIARGLDTRADAFGNAPQQLAVLLAQRAHEADLQHRIEHAAVLHGEDEHAPHIGAAQRRADLEVVLRQTVQRQRPALQRYLAHQPFAQLQRAAGGQLILVPGELCYPLQLAILLGVERAHRHVEVAGQEGQDALPQGRQRLLADDRFAQQGLSGAIPGLLFQGGRMCLLLFQRFGVGLRQAHQVASCVVNQECAE